MKKRSLLTALAVLSLSALAPLPALAGVQFGSIVVEIGVPPPPPRVEVVPVPRPGYVWTPGQWVWDGYRHAWIEGHWTMVRAGYAYVPSRWEQRGDRWHYEPERWEHHDHGRHRGRHGHDH